MDELNPLYEFRDTLDISGTGMDLPEIINSELGFDYKFQFKDFSLIAKFLGIEQLDIIGDGHGHVQNDSSRFSINTSLDLDYFINKSQNYLFYLSNLEANLNFSRDNLGQTFEKLFGAVSMTGKRLFSGTNINDIEADLIFNQNKLFFNISANLDTLLNTELEGNLAMTPFEQELSFDRLFFDYKGIGWENKNTIRTILKEGNLHLLDLSLHHENSVISVEGSLNQDGSQDIFIRADSVTGDIINNYLMGNKKQNIGANLNLITHIQGSLEDPTINVDLDINQISYDQIKFGFLKCNLDYFKENILVDIKFLDAFKNVDKPLLIINGNIPINLSMQDVEGRLISTQNVNLTLKSSNFNLNTFGDLLPAITNQKGALFADLQIGGTLDNLSYKGRIGIVDGTFRVRANKMDYKAGLVLQFKDDVIRVDSLVIQNARGAKLSGQMYGGGRFVLEGISLKEAKVIMSGDLAVLSQDSRSVSSTVYGDLLVGTNGDFIYSYIDNRSSVKGSLSIKKSELTYSTGQESIGSSGNDFIYQILIDSTKIDKEELTFQKLVASAQFLRDQTEDNLGSNVDFDYDIDVRIEDEAKFTFILSPVWNQKLVVQTIGKLRYESINGIPRAQGEIVLQQGSKLEFFKIFDAEGTLRFESKISDPYLDIIAKYSGTWIDANEQSQDVVIKMRIIGPLSQLGRTLASKSENFSVYVGARNIANNIPSSKYDDADAISFIIVGKFKDELTAQDKNRIGSETALGTTTSFLGSVLSGFVNSAVGDLINDIQLSQAGKDTRFSVSGKFQNVKYSIGGTQEVFQNIYKANIKVEYLFNPNFLIRLERKDPIVQSSGILEKINELGLKYRFQF